MAIVIDPGSGALAQGVARFGEGVSQAINRKQIREREIAQNPAQLAALAPAIRQAQEAGTLPRLAEALGVTEDFLTSSGAGFQATSEEQTDVAFQEAAGPQALGRQQALEAQVGAEQAGGLLESGILDKQIELLGAQTDVAIADAAIRGTELELAESLGIARLRVRGEEAELERGIQENVFQGSIFRLMGEGDTARLTVDTENARLRAQRQGFNLQIETVDAWKEFLDSLDPSSHAYQAAIAASVNPNFLSHVGLHEQMRLRASIETAALRGTPEDALAATKTVMDMQRTAMEYLRNLEDEEGADQDVLEAARLAVENSRRLAVNLSDEGIIYPIHAIGAEADISTLLRRERGVEFFGQEVESDAVRDILNALASGDASLADLGFQDPETGQTVLQEMSATDREEFLVNLPTIGERTARVAAGQQPQQMPPMTEAILNNTREKLRFLEEQRAKLDDPEEKDREGGIFRPGTGEILGIFPSEAEAKAELDQQIDILRQQLEYFESELGTQEVGDPAP